VVGLFSRFADLGQQEFHLSGAQPIFWSEIALNFVLFAQGQRDSVAPLFLEIRRHQPRQLWPFGLPSLALTKGGSVPRFDS
jgi:hypothetical protein